jgi:hypothetical protein
LINNYSKKQFNIKLEKIKQDIKSNFVEYVEILNNDEKAKESTKILSNYL